MIHCCGSQSFIGMRCPFLSFCALLHATPVLLLRADPGLLILTLAFAFLSPSWNSVPGSLFLCAAPRLLLFYLCAPRTPFLIIRGRGGRPTRLSPKDPGHGKKSLGLASPERPGGPPPFNRSCLLPKLPKGEKRLSLISFLAFRGPAPPGSLSRTSLSACPSSGRS